MATKTKQVSSIRTPASRTAGSRFFTVLTAALAMVFFCVPAFAGEIKQDIPDADITLAVEQELLEDGEVAAHRVDTVTHEGVVTLSGSVDNLLAKRRAIDLAEAIKGVRGVVDKIELNTPDVGDPELRTDVQGALYYDPATESYEVDVEADDGTITLTGAVESFQEKELAEEIAAGVKGVQAVDNQIEIDYAAERTDDEIRDDVVGRLANSIWIESGLVDVSVNEGNVKLTGTVGSEAEKTRAKQAAWVAGTESVDAGELEVEWWLRDEMKREDRFLDPSDDQIAEAIRDTFLYDPRVKSFKPDVDVENGVVTLTGTVSNLQAKQAAKRDARHVPGVLMVNNHLRVRPDEQPSDQDIQDNAAQALMRDPYVYRFDITLSVVNGHAYLYGTVDSQFEKEHAGEIVSSARGVADVSNYLRVSEEWTYADDWEIEQKIQDQLWWSPFVDAEDIEVTVSDGIATLTGEVDSWYERDVARENAYDGGADSVILELDVNTS